MPATLENPVINADASSELDSLLAAASAADREFADADARGDAPAGDGEGTDVGEGQQTEGQPEGEQSKPVPNKEEADKAKDKLEQPEKPETPYVKAKKDAERLDKTWKSVNERKAELDRKEAELTQREQQAATNRAPVSTAPPAPKFQAENQPGTDGRVQLRDDKGFTATDYESAARDFLANGDEEMAAECQRRVGVIRQAEHQHGQQQHEQAFNGFRAQIIREQPEFGKPESRLSQVAENVLNNEPRLRQWRDGYVVAATYAKLFVQAEEAKALKEQVKTLTAERDGLRKKTAIQGGGPTRPSTPPPFADLNHEQAEAELLRLAEAADRNQ